MESVSGDNALVKTTARVESAGLSRSAEKTILITSLVACDLAMIGIAMRFAYWVRFDLNLPFFQLGVFSSQDYYQNLVVYILPIWVIIFFLRGLYRWQNLLGGTQEYDLLFQANIAAMFLVIGIGFFQEDLIFARGWILVSWISAVIFTFTGRFLLRRLFYNLREKGFYLSRAVILGYNEEAKLMAGQLSDSRYSGLRLLGYVDAGNLNPDEPLPPHHLGSIDNLDEILRKNRVDEIILTSSALTREQFVHIFKLHGVANGVRLRMSSGLYEIITTGMQVKDVAWVPLLEVNKARLTGLDLVLKTVLDYGLAIPAVILISPVLLVLALAVKLDSHGPIIHRRRVMGVNGKQFDAFKFRTMHVNGDEILARYPDLQEELATKHKLKNDPRITRVGRFIRKWSLDELPQLFNVLRNEMSIVGPRIITREEVAEYKKFSINLLTVKPGITGKWQVSGRSEISYQERVRLDMYYIRNWNIWLDLQLLIQTIPAVLSKRGAY